MLRKGGLSLLQLSAHDAGYDFASKGVQHGRVVMTTTGTSGRCTLFVQGLHCLFGEKSEPSEVHTFER